MHPVIFQLGSFKLPAYGLMVACGYLAAILWLTRRAGAAGFRKEDVSDLIFYSVLAGMAGAKLFYAVTYWDSFGPDFLARGAFLLRTFQYGFVFYGGLLAGAAAFFLAARRKRLDALKAADLFAPALALGHAFGRLGCFLAGCCHGRPSGSLLAVTFTDPACEVDQALLGVPLYPTQLLEAGGNLLIFALLAGALRRRLRPGAVLTLYAGLYSALRFLLEFLRGDDRGGTLLGASPAQLISLAVLACSAALFYLLKAKHEKN
ncbi:MAG: prolipoprotein diacylglyceryl transferase [Elusimicrobiales bacterium]|nr:prolipoprotein diacylglyceryl transferase [Elusimicrobiales bacterium]